MPYMMDGTRLQIPKYRLKPLSGMDMIIYLLEYESFLVTYTTYESECTTVARNFWPSGTTRESINKRLRSARRQITLKDGIDPTVDIWRNILEWKFEKSRCHLCYM